MKWTDQSPQQHFDHLPDSIANAACQRILCTPAGNPIDHQLTAFIAPPVHRQVLDHLRQKSVEQGGLLIGQAWLNPQGGQPMTVSVIDSVVATSADASGVSLRMDTSIWGAANERLAHLNAACAGRPLRIIGWYHSHPGLGAFFSTTDRQTQAAFFKHDYSLGWVIDPTDDSHACFIGANSTACSAGLVPIRTVDSS